ncbi:MAG: response regulator transcription factor [Planctomycetota bacterium]|jgi:two-component system chemotaxis response regulator CheY
MKALVVEDDDICRISLYTKLESLGFEIAEARDGESALAQVKSAADEGSYFKLICLDINLPGIDGMEVLKQIRDFESEKFDNREDKSKIVMVTSDKDMDRMVNAFDVECDSYLTKPVAMDHLKTHLADLGLI